MTCKGRKPQQKKARERENLKDCFMTRLGVCTEEYLIDIQTELEGNWFLRTKSISFILPLWWIDTIPFHHVARETKLTSKL